MMDRIVVTGALGHIGSRLVRTLPDTFPETEVVMVDDLSSQRVASLFDLPQDAQYRFVEADILEADLEALFDGADAVIHLAAITDATRSFEDPNEVRRVNHKGTERVAHACLDVGARLIFPSTTSVYGPQGETVDEAADEKDLDPQSPYAESKLDAERSLTALADTEGLSVCLFRFGTIFGTSPGMRFHTVVNKFCWLAALGRPLTVWSTAMDQRRPYLDLGDAIRAIAFTLERDLFDGALYNAVTVNLTVRDLVETIQQYIPDVEIELVDKEIMNQHSYEVSNRKLRDRGFSFHGELDRAVRETLEMLAPVSDATLQIPGDR